jgi:hypothetical protein
MACHFFITQTFIELFKSKHDYYDIIKEGNELCLIGHSGVQKSDKMDMSFWKCANSVKRAKVF